METIKDVLEPNEKVLWKGKPVLIPFLLSGITISTIIGIFVLSQFISAARYSFASGDFFIGLLPIYFGMALVFGPIIYRLLVYNNVFYFITDKRVIFEGGIIAPNFKTIDFDQIANAGVNIDIFDKAFGKGSGSIMVATSGNFEGVQANNQYM